MAEPLQTLFSSIRRPRQRRRMQWEPVAVQGGSSPGMRGSISPLDSVAMTDSAQGVDISSIAPPTRLQSEGAERAYEQEPQADTASPFMFASNREQAPVQQVSQGGVRYEKRCDDGVCQMVPVFDDAPAPQAMQAQSLPEGVVLDPGQSYVPGSLREVPSSTASAPQASVAAAPMAAPTQAPRLDPQADFATARAAMQDALNAFRMGQPAEAVLHRNISDKEMAIGNAVREQRLTDEINERADALEKIAAARADRLVDLRDPKKQHQVQQDIISGIRNGPGNASARAIQVIQHKLSGLKGVTFGEDDLTKMIDAETAIITAYDLSKNMDASFALDRQIGGAQPTPQQSVARQLLQSRSNQLLFDRYGKITDGNLLRQRIDGELRAAYDDAIRRHLRQSSSPLSGDDLEVEVARRVNAAVSLAIDAVGRQQAGASAFASYQPPELSRPTDPVEPSPAEPAQSSPQKSGGSWWDAISSGPW